MNNILSGISGYFSKSMILGTFLPVVIFSTLAWLTAAPSLPNTEFSLFKPLETLDAQWKLLAFTLLMVVAAGFLYNINNPLIRLYQGYPWAELWIGKRRKAVYQKRFKILRAQWLGLPWLEYELNSVQENDPRIKLVQDKKSIVGRTLKTDFPEEERLVLPTRLGNVIRSSENYSNLQYNIEAVILWPRLVAKIDKDYAAQVEDSKTSFDFMLNCSVLSSVLSVMFLTGGLLYPAPLTSARSTVFWIAEIGISWAAAHLFYRLAIGQAKAWGNMVKGAFDLYRWELLKQLGYSRLPSTVKEERALWLNISQRMIYGDTYLVPPAEYSPRTTFVEANPDFATLEVARGIDLPEETGELVVKLRVANRTAYKVEEVIVTDTLPAEFQYKWASASVENESSPVQDVTVVGTNPYHFSVGLLNPSQGLTLTYKALLVKKEVKPADPPGPADNRLAIDFRWVRRSG